MQQNMIESRKLHSQLADDMNEIRSRFGKLEEKMNIQLSSIQHSKGGAVVEKEAKSTAKLLYAVQAENGSQAGIESRLLPRFSSDKLSWRAFWPFAFCCPKLSIAFCLEY